MKETIFKTLLSGVLLIFINTVVNAQENKYWVYFKDKNIKNDARKCISIQTLKNRILLGLQLCQYTDIPLTDQYEDSVKSYSAIVNRSKWLNAVSVYLNEKQLSKIKSLYFVERVEPIKSSFVYAGNSHALIDDYALEQVQASALKKKHLSGRGVSIGLIDGGFFNANTSPLLAHVYSQQRVIIAKDFIDTARKDFYQGPGEDVGNHGTSVLTLLAGKNIGLAQDSYFYLIRSDHHKREFRLEEDYWIAGLELLDSLGVRLVNSSLGYSMDYDSPLENHTPEEIDGKTCAITKAAQVAVKEKGMILVVSAGNEGQNKSWKIVTAPADAEGVIAVGATDELPLKREISSIGPNSLPYLKPDVVCYSPGGTSFSAPIITGLIACILQEKPSLQNTEVAEILRKSSSLYPYGNNFMGFGIPNAGKAIKMISDPKLITKSEEVKTNNSYLRFENSEDYAITVFHKKNDGIVVKQEVIFKEGKGCVINRSYGASRSTVVFSNKITEILWNE